MDNKKLQEFLKKVEAQSAQVNADDGIQTLSDNVAEEGAVLSLSGSNARIIANSVEYRNNFKFEDKFIESFNVTESKAYGGGATYIDKDSNIGVIVDYEAFLQTCMLADTEVNSCKLALCGRNRASKLLSLYPLDSDIKICDIEQMGGFYVVDLLTVKEACGGYDFRLGDAEIMDTLQPDKSILVINDGMMIVTDFTIYKEEGPQKNVQAIIDNAVNFKNSYRVKDKFITFFNVDENQIYTQAGVLDFDMDLAVLVDYEALIYAYGLKLTDVKSCKLILCGKTKAGHECSLFPFAGAIKFCDIAQDNNLYIIDLKTLYDKMGSADFRLGDPNLMDSLSISRTQLIINDTETDMITITDFSIAAVGGTFKDNESILSSAENFRRNYKFTDGFIKLFDTDGRDVYAENDFLTVNETTDLIGILDYKKLLFLLGYRTSGVQTVQLKLHGRVPEASKFNLYSLDTKEFVDEIITNSDDFKTAIDLKYLYEKYGTADFILEKTNFVESFYSPLSTVVINDKVYSLLELFDNSGGYKEGETVFKNLALAGGAQLSLNLNSGSAVSSFGAVNAEDFIIPVTVSNVHAEGNGDKCCGRNWRLNLDRKLNVSEEDTLSTTVYTFTDETGKAHSFTETYYYLENGVKNFVKKNSVTIDVNGNLTYNDKEVKKQQSCEGYTLIPEINDYIDSEFIDQRLSEQAELEDYVKSLERSLSEYVGVSINNKGVNITRYPLSKAYYKRLIRGATTGTNTYLMTESEALQLKSLYANKEQLGKQSAQINFQKSQIDLQKKQLELQNKQIGQQISDLEHTKIYTEKQNGGFSSSSNFVNQSAEEFFANYELPSEQETTEQGDGGGRGGSSGGGGGGGGSRSRSNDSSDNDLSDAEYLNLIQDEMTYKSAVKNLELLDSGNTSTVDQKKLAAEQQSLITEQEKILADQTATLNDQLSYVIIQIDYLLSQARKNLDSVNDAFKNYFGKKDRLDYTLLHTPVNYLKDGNGLISGFSRSGDLVCIFDTYGNSVAVEYDKSARIVGLHDSEGKAISFKYSGGKIESITDTRGRKVKYRYTEENLTSVEFADGSTINFVYVGEKLVSAISNNAVCGQISYLGEKVTAVKTLSKPLTIEKNMQSGEEGEYTEVLSSVTVSYTDGTVKLDYSGGTCDKYTFIDGVKLHGYSQTDALGFETVTKYTSYGDFADFIVTLTRNTASPDETTLKVYCKETEKLLSEYSAANISDVVNIKACKKYIYDEDDRLISETTEKITTINGEEEKTSAVVNYHYGANGNLILTESKICGEEQTSGVNFTERTYDKNGNVTKTVSWNSLDASAKFYTQNDVAENGQVTAERDETGEISAEYEYVEGTNVVNTVTQANGSKLSYGRNPFDLNVTSVTQSTADGEANTTDIIYELGLPVEVKSGNTVINYAYDCHGRKTCVKVNGEVQSSNVYSDYEYNAETGKTLFGAATETERINDTETVTYYSEKTAVNDEATGRKKVTETYNINGEEVLVKNYDANNNITDISDYKAGTFTEFTYDAHNRLTAVETAINGKNYLTENCSYNERGELASQQITGGLELTYAYSYRDNAARTLDKINVNETLEFIPLSDVNGRNTGKEVYFAEEKLCGEYVSYRKVGDHATNMPSTVWFASGANIRESMRYKYDRCGNIAQITHNGDKAVSYEYDSLNRLARENNKPLNKTVIFSYDTNGNILSRCEYPYTVKSGEELSELACRHYDYIYEGDRLIKIVSPDGEETFAYNNLGSPETYRNKKLQWQYGKLLTRYGDTTFEYDGSGRRTKKGETEYKYNSEGKLISSSNSIYYLYDDKGVAGFINNKGLNLYRKDAQGNVIAILDSDGAVVVRYEYDAWGNHKVLDAEGHEITDPEHVGNVNPFRYRGYFYDVETGLYYLQTRYYDPSIGRFISQDSIEYADPQSINGLNLYAYCANNPVMAVDPTGTKTKWWEWLLGALVVVALTALVVVTAGAAALAIGTALGVGSSLVAATMIGAAVGGIAAGGFELISQGIATNWQTVDFKSLAIETFTGAAYGAISGMMGSTTSAALRFGLRFGIVAVSGINTALHGIAERKSFGEIMADVGISLAIGLLIQGVMVGYDAIIGKLSSAVLDLYKLDGVLFTVRNVISIGLISIFKILWGNREDFYNRIIN